MSKTITLTIDADLLDTLEAALQLAYEDADSEATDLDLFNEHESAAESRALAEKVDILRNAAASARETAARD